MEQDIRKLFKEEEVTKKKLPAAHRDEFKQKLKNIKPKQKKSFKHVFKYAAAIVAFVSIGYMSYTNFWNSTVNEQSALEIQIKEIEHQYLESIEKEWQNFRALTKDEKLVARYKKELDELNTDYQRISKQFKENKNDILIIENLVENLQTRLQLLKDIQDHIKLLNQKNAHYETIQI